MPNLHPSAPGPVVCADPCRSRNWRHLLNVTTEASVINLGAPSGRAGPAVPRDAQAPGGPRQMVALEPLAAAAPGAFPERASLRAASFLPLSAPQPRPCSPSSSSAGLLLTLCRPNFLPLICGRKGCRAGFLPPSAPP